MSKSKEKSNIIRIKELSKEIAQAIRNIEAVISNQVTLINVIKKGSEEEREVLSQLSKQLDESNKELENKVQVYGSRLELCNKLLDMIEFNKPEKDRSEKAKEVEDLFNMVIEILGTK